MSEIVMPERMKQRRAKLLNATYEYFLTLLEMDRNEVASRFPLDEKLMWVLFGYADTMLERLGYNVCCPDIYVQDGKKILCNTTYCGCKTCHIREASKMSEQLRDVIESAGYTIVSEDITGIKIRNPKDDECTISVAAKLNS